MPDFSGSVQRLPKEKWGEHPSVLDFIPQSQHGSVRDGSSTTDVTGWIQDGLDSLATAGGGILYLPWGVYPVVDIDIPSNVTLVGDGPAKTILKRRSNLPTGRGVLNIAGVNSGFESLAIDGQVTSPQTALYSSLSDPSSTALTANSSVRIHPGAKDVSLRRFRIFHSGGYAVHIDARTGDVYRVEIEEPHLHDNRSWLFGAVSGSAVYGSWTGGILAQGNGQTGNYAVRGFRVIGGTFRRGTGNQVWSHLYGFGTLHTDFKIQGCTFEDIGRDGIMLGGVVGGDIAGNFFRRIGYICTDDISAGVPRWINGQWAVGLDTAGLTRGVSYRGNSFVSCYGAAMDLDGFAEGVVSDNTVIVPAVGEPEYAEDAIASWAGNYCYGAQTSNTNNLADAAVGVRVTGNRFRNCGLGAVRMYASRRGSVSGNTIEHPAGATVAPIVLGNIGSGANQRAYANTVTDNDIHYSPAAITASVQEDPNGFAFSGSDINRVYGNRLHGTNTFEFLRAATSGSRTAREFASNKSGLAAESKTTLQREDGYLRAYWTNGSVTKSVLSLLDQAALSGGGSGGPLLNISLDAVGGVIATGARTSSAFDDAMLSSKVYADGFLAIAATTFSAADANLLADTVGLIRYNSTSKIFEQSTSVAAGARVWTPLSPQALSGLTAGRIPYTTSANAIADTANLAWNNTGRVLTVTGATGTASIVAATSFIQSQEGFLTTSAASTAINALSGGVSALSLISVRNDGAAGVNFVRNAGANQRSFGIGVNAAGQLFVSDQTAVATRITVNAAGLVTVGSTVSIDQAGNLSASATVAAAGVNVSGAAFNSLQVPAGGLYAGLGATLDQGLYLKTFAGAPNTPGGGYGALSHRSGSTYLYWDGSAWQTVNLAVVGGGVTSVTGTANQVNVSAATGAVTISLPQNIHTGASPSFAGMTVSNSAGSTVGGVAGVVSVVDGSFAAASPRFMVRNTSAFSSGASIELNGSTARWSIGQDIGQTGANNFYLFDRVAGGTRFLIDSGGNVAIGANSVTTLTSNAPKLEVVGSTRTTWGHGQNALFILPAANNGAATGDAGLYFWISEPGSTWTGAGIGRNMYNMTNWPRVNSALTSQMIRFGEWADISFVSEVPGGTRYYPMTLYEDRVLVSTQTDDSSGAKLQVNGFARAITGFSTPATATDAIQAPSGGVTARFLIGTRSVTLTADSAANAGLSGSAQGRIYFDSSTNKFRVSENGGAYVDLLSATGVTSLAGTANQVNVSASTGAVTLSLPQSIHTGASPSFGGLTVTGIIGVGSSPSTALGNVVVTGSNGFIEQPYNFRAVARFSGDANSGIILDTAGVANSSGYRRGISWSYGTDDFRLARFATNGTSGRLTDLYVHSNGNVLVATESDDGSGARLQVNGFARAITGFATPATATDAIQAPSGGVTARFLIGTRSLTLTADSAANAGLSGSAQGRIYFDSSTNKFRVSENGGAYVDLLSATGVTSLAGTANQVNVSASTGAVTLSLPQSIHTGASPTFAGVTAGAFSATATGTAIGFQTSNFNFQVNGNGVVSSAGGINVAGATVIDSSRNATNLASATASGVFQSQASGTSIAFQTTNFNFQVNGNGVVSAAGGINVSGSTVINTSRQFVGSGVDVGSNGISAGGYNVSGGYTGQTWNVVGSFTINGTSYTTLIFRGGILVSAS